MAVMMNIYSKGVNDLIQKSAAIGSGSKLLSQIHWDNVPQWIKSVAGVDCKVILQEIHIETGGVAVGCCLTGVDYGVGDLTIDVKISTIADSHGMLDLTKSSSMALENLRFELKNTDMYLGPNDEVLNSLWDPVQLPEYAQYAIQYPSRMSQSCMVIVSGNCLIKLHSGSASSLEPVARRILSYTTVDRPLSLHIPNIIQYHFLIPDSIRGHKSNVVKGIGFPLAVHCKFPHAIGAATAHVLDYGLLLRDCTIDTTVVPGMSIVNFMFLTHTIGMHDVDLRFASSPSMISGTKRIQVEVIEGEFTMEEKGGME